MPSEEAFIIENLFRIADKEGNDVDFRLNREQSVLDEGLCGRDLVPKARQLGISSYVLGRYTAACLAKRNVKAVVISHDLESTQRMLNKVKYFIENIRGPKPVVQNMSKNEITFPKMNSTFYLGTAGARKFGRGDTITHLHCSEYAFWPNAKALMTGLMQAVPYTGEIIIESTGNGMNDYYSRCEKAAKGTGRWRLHFFNWLEFPEYSIKLTNDQAEELMSNLDPDMEEEKLVGLLTPGQIAWRRDKLEELDYDLKGFNQEYPISLSDCFQASGNSIFYKVLYSPTDDWERVDHDMWKLKGHPNKDKHYAVGVDASAGVGKDNATIEVICLEDMEQVCEIANNRIEPDLLGDRAANIGEQFNQAFVTVESNNHGILTLSRLEEIYPFYLIYSKDVGAASEETMLNNMGFRTTARSKPLMIGKLRRLLANQLVIHSEFLSVELSTFVEHEDGKMSAQDGCMDDRVMGMACACVGLEEAGLYLPASMEEILPQKTTNPFSFEAIYEELTNKRFDFPIKPQV